MAIAYGTCISFCNQPKAHYLATYLTRVTPVCRCGCRHLATSRESKVHFGFPWVRPWIEREFSACQMPRSMYTYIFNRFQVIQPESSKVCHFSTFFAHFGLPGYAPGTITVSVTWIEREINDCQMPRNMYPSIFNHFPVIQAISLKVCHF